MYVWAIHLIAHHGRESGIPYLLKRVAQIDQSRFVFLLPASSCACRCSRKAGHPSSAGALLSHRIHNAIFDPQRRRGRYETHPSDAARLLGRNLANACSPMIARCSAPTTSIPDVARRGNLLGTRDSSSSAMTSRSALRRSRRDLQPRVPGSPIHYNSIPCKPRRLVHGAINMLGLAKRVKARILQAPRPRSTAIRVHHRGRLLGRVNPIGPGHATRG